MADTTYAVKVSDEVKQRLQKLVEESGQSSKDFFIEMISQFELANARKQAPILSADIDELMKLTTRINNIFINVGERIVNLQESNRIEAENEMKEKENLIGLLQKQIEGLNHDTVKGKAQIDELAAANKALSDEAKRLEEMNMKNDEIISGYNEKIDSLTDLVTRYKGYADEIQKLKNESTETQQAIEKIKRENENLNKMLTEKENQINHMQGIHAEELERQKEKFKIEKGRALLEQREQYNRELDEVREVYQKKINQLLHIGDKPKREPKKKEEIDSGQK